MEKLFNVPILFMIYNRPDLTQAVFNEIRKIKPETFYIAADGPRIQISDDKIKCQESRKIINQIDWKCNVNTLFQHQNIGLKNNVSCALDWFFQNVKEGIILEDDCLPHQSFFYFSEELLERYRNDERIMAISGGNFQAGNKRGLYSYYFSKYPHIWGWATWRRAWNFYDKNMKLWPEIKKQNLLYSLLGNKKLVFYWSGVFQNVYAGKINTWDTQLVFAFFIRRGLTVIPNVNLVSNIGFRKDATHTFMIKHPFSNMKCEAMDFPLKHPPHVSINFSADKYTESIWFIPKRKPFLIRVFIKVFKLILLKKINLGMDKKIKKKLLIVRPDAIGDFIIFSAVFKKYAEIFPGYKIDLLCHPKVKDLAVTIPFIDRVICVNTFKLFRKRYFFYFIFWLARLKMLEYEKVIYPAYSRIMHDDLVVKTMRAKEKIVFDGNDSNDPKKERFGRNQFFTRIIESEKRLKPDLERNAEFVNKLGGGLDSADLKTKIWFLENDKRLFDRLRLKYGLEINKYVCISPGAAYSCKYWPADKWAGLVDFLIKEYPVYKIAVLGAGQDKAAIESILILLNLDLKKNLINLYNKTSLRVMAKAIENAKLFIGMDSGPLHIAAAVNTPNIGLIGGGEFGRFYPYGDSHKNRAVYKKMDCFGCSYRCRFNDFRCVKEIEIQDVCREIGTFLQ